ncbi:MAG: MBOAT family protein [Bacteroidetes bacterium]|nr:MBOAT family protein [Bacteroidota bacterium]
MLFNSIQFALFFLVVTIVFFLIPHRFRWIHLLIASCVFYCAFVPIYILILFFTILIDYIAGIYIEDAQGARRKLLLTISLVSNLGVLAFFKYYNFFIENVNALIQTLGLQVHEVPYLNILLPIGLSFHTFQAMSYVIEVYRGNQKAERHLGLYSLYVLFYPQLVAGPIERPQNVLHQFREEKKFDSSEAISGLQQMIWGLFKKVVVADQLAIYVNSIYNNWEVNTGFTLLFATYCFAFQIYCDFSGYSDIALGAARVMGYRLMTNFSLPYFSKSVTEFWRRWHISLSSWLKDYLYISLGGNRLGKWKTYRNLILTMLLGGLWHGASWNFVIWGFLNGIYLSIEKVFDINKIRASSLLFKCGQVFITFHLICLTWIFFRANTFKQAIGILGNMIQPLQFWNLRIQDTGIFAGMTFGFVILIIFEFFFFRKKGEAIFTMSSPTWSAAWLVGFTLLIVLFGVSDGDQFIYFQF